MTSEFRLFSAADSATVASCSQMCDTSDQAESSVVSGRKRLLQRREAWTIRTVFDHR